MTDYEAAGAALAEHAPPLTDEQVRAAARIYATGSAKPNVAA